MNLYLLLLDTTTEKVFKKYFKTEYEMDKFKRRLIYSKKLSIIEDSRSVILDYEK